MPAPNQLDMFARVMLVLFAVAILALSGVLGYVSWLTWSDRTR